MSGVGATRFAAMVRFLAAESREAGLVVPAFRSPPQRPGTMRTIRRTRDGAVVSVALRGRAEAAVAADMIEGIVVANALDTAAAESTRRRLRRVVLPEAEPTGAPARSRNLPPPARVAERQTQAA